MQITRNVYIIQAEDQLSCKLGKELAILNVNSSLYFGLNEIGTAIWGALKVPKTAAQICEYVLSNYDVDAGRCEADVITFLNDLREAGLVKSIENHIVDAQPPVAGRRM